MNAGDRVRMSEALKARFRANGGEDHVAEFGECVGVVEGLLDYGTQKGPDVDVRWEPSRLRGKVQAKPISPDGCPVRQVGGVGRRAS
jgi:hypothetical protein